MILLYLCPPLFGLPDNNPYGLKVDAFMRIAGIDYTIKPVSDTSNAPRNQLPYLDDNGKLVGDSNNIINYLIESRGLKMDDDLTDQQRHMNFLLTRMMDMHLYWVMLYSRWQDERYYPQFKAALLEALPTLTPDEVDSFRDFNMKRSQAQGIGRFSANEVYDQGIDNLRALQFQLGDQEFMFGDKFHVLDASCYGFLANIYYFPMQTPLKDYLLAEPLLASYIERIRSMLSY